MQCAYDRRERLLRSAAKEARVSVALMPSAMSNLRLPMSSGSCLRCLWAWLRGCELVECDWGAARSEEATKLDMTGGVSHGGMGSGDVGYT